MIRNQFAAEYGRASGGRVNLRTRGGSNKFHGRFYDFFRNDVFNANTFNNKRLGLPRTPFEEHDPGFTFSGPIVLPFLQRSRSDALLWPLTSSTRFLTQRRSTRCCQSTRTRCFLLPAPTNSAASRTENPPAPALIATNGIAPFIENVSTPQRNQIFTTRIDHKFTDMHNGQINYQLGRFTNLRQFGGGSRLAEALQAKTR
jgi:hypothetical protein